MQVVFHARMAEEAGHFDFEAVAGSITDKMLRRHPHVFGSDAEKAAGAQQGSWEQIKAAERAGNGDPSVLAGVARALPALKRAQKLGKRAAHAGFDWPDREGVRAKVHEELDELEEVAESSRADRIEEELGDLLFTIVNLARHLKVDPEKALAGANNKFERRFRDMEQAIAAEGRELAQESLAVLEQEWQAAKRRSDS